MIKPTSAVLRLTLHPQFQCISHILCTPLLDHAAIGKKFWGPPNILPNGQHCASVTSIQNYHKESRKCHRVFLKSSKISLHHILYIHVDNTARLTMISKTEQTKPSQAKTQHNTHTHARTHARTHVHTHTHTHTHKEDRSLSAKTLMTGEIYMYVLQTRQDMYMCSRNGRDAVIVD